jgi:hypothetical protein
MGGREGGREGNDYKEESCVCRRACLQTLLKKKMLLFLSSFLDWTSTVDDSHAFLPHAYQSSISPRR